MAYSRQVSNSERFREQALSGFPDGVGIHAGWTRVPELWTLGGSSRYETILAINHLVQRRRCAGAVYG